MGDRGIRGAINEGKMGVGNAKRRGKERGGGGGGGERLAVHE